MKKIILMLFAAVIVVSCSQEKKLLRKAAVAVEQSDFEKALKYYDQILRDNKDSYFGNAGKGVVLSEYMEQHEKAIPFLEKALEKSPKKTMMKLNYDLGKSYHHVGNYERALYFYSKAIPYNNPDNPDYDAFLTKRIADCKYAMSHTEINPSNEQWVKNVGKPLNSEMPEYSPVCVNNSIIFTSQRKDDPKEKKNGVDGRYFEKMYICKMKDGVLSPPVRYTLPGYEKNDKFNKTNESVISASADNKTLFLYRDGKIFESSVNDPSKGAVKMDESINFSHLQNHACVSKDGKTIFFTSESDKGAGGTDIYKSVKNEEGDWSPPELVSFNTLYNEDSPFLAEDGTLFFSSNGLPGYGGYDVYKTRFENGSWSTPENLGQPVNSPGDDIYFALKPGSAEGYYASSRPGGYGDMDIYQVHYMINTVKDCNKNDVSVFTLNATPRNDDALKYDISLEMPDSYSNKVRSYSWTLNNMPVDVMNPKFEHRFKTPGTYTVSVKTIIFCDTCISLVARCNEKVIHVGDGVLSTPTSQKTPDVTSKTKNESLDKQGFLSESALAELNWNTAVIYFDYNNSSVKDNLRNALEQNAIILKKNKNLNVIINGFADSRGTEAYNKTLSAKRANMVKSYFVKSGIPQSRIVVNSYGESQLVNKCSDGVECSEEDHQANRRAELKVMYKPYKSPVTLK